MSRLGDPAPQPPARSGAARFAAPAAPVVPPPDEQKKPELTSKRQNVEALPVAQPTKQPMTIRLTPAAIDRLADLERQLRRGGIRARRASASEIVEALITQAELDELRVALGRRR
ncbi:MAG: hypothetical protein WAN59_03200 [Candidatus Baltobacteraceae bacterium]